jgi:putative addiction module CopG family antidote
MSAMSIHLPPQLAQTIQELVVAGSYQTPTEVIREAVMLLKDRYRAHAERLDESPRD